MSEIEAKIKRLGYTLPQAPKPVADYVPGMLDNNIIYTSGQLPLKDGVLCKGKLGKTLQLEEGYVAAKTCALNCLSVLKSVVGDLDRVVQIVKVVGFVNSSEDFTDHSKVINGASELLGEIFGVAGQHARSAIGVSSLPFGAACEVEIVARVQ